MDDIVILSDNLGEARDILQDLNDTVQEIGLTINFEQTKMMTNMVPSDQIQINNKKKLLTNVYTWVMR